MLDEALIPWISLLLLGPLAGALLVWLPAERYARAVALAIALATLLLAIGLLLGYDRGQAGFQFVEQQAWIPSLNIHYRLGVDGLSLLFLPFTGLLFVGVILASWTSARSLPRLYYSLLLLLEGFILGVFCALDHMLFFLFWEATLIPIYFLISLWGIGPHRRYAAVKYSLFMLAGGVPLLFGFLLLAIDQGGAPGGLVFDHAQLLGQTVGAERQRLIFFLLFLGFAVKTPLFPFHTWLPTVAMEGPVGIAALMTGLKLGAYGLLRFTVPLAPQAAQEFHWLFAGLGVIGILYGAVVALAQSNLRRMLAYSSISHVGLVVLGIASFNLQGIQGALFQLLNFSLIAGGLFLITGFLQHRTGTTELVSLGGAARGMPLLAAFFLLFGLAAMGVPGTSGFPAELLILLSALETHAGAGLAALFGLVLGAGYFLSCYRRAFLGPVRSEVVAEAVDLGGRELLIVALFALLVLGLGLYPQPLLDLIEPASQAWLGRLISH